MARVFLSHASADKPIVRRIASVLRAAGHDTWLDEEQILVGESIPAAVERGLRDADFVVICLSKAAAERGWIEAERDATLMQQLRERKERILPVRLEEVAPPHLIAPLAYVDLFPDEQAFTQGVARLTRSIEAHRARHVGRIRVSELSNDVRALAAKLIPSPPASKIKAAVDAPERVLVLGRVTADLVVLTVLPEEYAAVLACLHDPELLRATAATPNAYAWRLGTIASSHYDAPFTVAVGMGTPTTTFGALAAIQAMTLFHPRYIAFVGVAGGFDRDGQRHGDVAVSSVVTAYEYGKVDTGGFAPRGNFTYRCNEALVRAADVVSAMGARWWDDADNPDGPPRARTGMIASGDKVIDDPDEAFFAAVRAAWPKLLAVEMEGAGVAAAVHEVQGQVAVGFILVRGISDMPHSKAPGASASTQERDGWKVTASRNAARFLVNLIATAWPVPPRGDTDAASTAIATSSNPPAVGGSVHPREVNRVAPTPTYGNPEVEALSEQLERAWQRKQNLRRAGIATDEVDRDILQLRRQLREGGQLRAGDALGDGRYLLVKPVGRGGFAVVWEAFDRTDQRRVAIKVLHSHLASDPQRRERFFRGALVMMELKHPAVVRVHDPNGEDDAFCHFVMELVPGGNLRDAVLDQRVEAARGLPLILQIGEALAEAHQKGLVHRDVKPANVLLDAEGNAKLTDFDLVGAHDTTGGTRTGALGTVVYAAPECLDKPQDATARADVFGLGMTAIFCLAGQNLSMATFRGPAATVAQLECSRSVRAVIERAVAWEPGLRFADASTMVDALRCAVDGSVRAVSAEFMHGVQKAPDWAVASGTDQYGLWAEFEVSVTSLVQLSPYTVPLRGEHGVRHRMRWIPSGTFLMGSPETELGRFTSEGPQHKVTFARGFWLGGTPVTQELWFAVMYENLSHFRDEKPEALQRPVENVSWDDCWAFLAQLNAQVAGLTARLPSEAEWEYACRAGTSKATSVGDLSGEVNAIELNAVAWYRGNSERRTHAVGGQAPNLHGLHDMLGNVWEWCQDAASGMRGPHDFESKPVADPVPPTGGPRRVIRGGAWDSDARYVRAACRHVSEHDSRSDGIGFRLVVGTSPP